MKVALVWGGDQASACAYSKIKGKFDVSYLLMFLQKGRSNPDFLESIKKQCQKIGVPFFWAKMRSSNPKEYREVITELKEDYGIEGIVTNGVHGVIEDACKAVSMKVIEA
jgi:diphthamide synthase (EF-2-diphthine--ammonia ligase)